MTGTVVGDGGGWVGKRTGVGIWVAGKVAASALVAVGLAPPGKNASPPPEMKVLATNKIIAHANKTAAMIANGIHSRLRPRNDMPRPLLSTALPER